MEKNLKEFLNNGGFLTEEQKDILAAIIGKGSREKTKNRVKSCVRWSMRDFCNRYNIFSRFYIRENGDIYYCAGQSYRDEILVMRELMK